MFARNGNSLAKVARRSLRGPVSSWRTEKKRWLCSASAGAAVKNVEGDHDELYEIERNYFKNNHDSRHNNKNTGMKVKNRNELVDSYGRKHDYLRISLTERCNLRCTYCMPENGVELKPDDEMLTDEEIVQIASVFVENGVSKIRLTGGEPLIRKNIIDMCTKLKLLGVKDLALTTNGILLKRKLDPLVDAGVNLLNISLDTLVPAKFQIITRRNGFEQVWNSIQRAANHPKLDQVKVNCVVKRGLNEDELVDFVRITKDLNIELRFIEFMPFDGNKWDSKAMLPYYEMVDMIQEEFPDFHRTRSQDSKNAVSKTWKVPGFKGSVGFISSMSSAFCGTCSRLRLTSDGNIKVCLFGKEEISLRDALRSGKGDQELTNIISQAVFRKHAKLGGYENPEAISMGENRAMVRIGG